MCYRHCVSYKNSNDRKYIVLYVVLCKKHIIYFERVAHWVMHWPVSALPDWVNNVATRGKPTVSRAK